MRRYDPDEVAERLIIALAKDPTLVSGINAAANRLLPLNPNNPETLFPSEELRQAVQTLSKQRVSQVTIVEGKIPEDLSLHLDTEIDREALQMIRRLRSKEPPSLSEVQGFLQRYYDETIGEALGQSGSRAFASLLDIATQLHPNKRGKLWEAVFPTLLRVGDLRQNPAIDALTEQTGVLKQRLHPHDAPADTTGLEEVGRFDAEAFLTRYPDQAPRLPTGTGGVVVIPEGTVVTLYWPADWRRSSGLSRPSCQGLPLTESRSLLRRSRFNGWP